MEAAPEATAALPKNHYDTEQHIIGLGVDWTFLRPNYYMQNMLMYAASISRTGSFALPLGGAKTAMIDARDVGEVAAVALTGAGHAGQVYRLTGPSLMDFHEVAQRMGGVLQREIRYVEQTSAAFRAVLEQFIQSAWQLDAVRAVCRDRCGISGGTKLDYRRFTGSPRHGFGILRAAIFPGLCSTRLKQSEPLPHQGALNRLECPCVIP